MNMQLLSIITFLFSAAIAAPQISAGILGRILNRDGSPASNIRVMAVSADEASLKAGREIVSFGETDAAGNYRLDNVPPGRYFVTAGIVESPSYYPGVKDASCATIVTVKAGSSLRGIDFLQVASQKISGRVKVLPGSPALTLGIGTHVRLMSEPGLAQFAKIAPDGTFEFSAVAQGEYYAMVSPGVQMVPVSIVVEDHNIQGIELSVPPSRTVRGKVSIEGGGKISEINFVLGRSTISTAAGIVNAINGTSFFAILPQGSMPIAVSQTSLLGYSVKSFTFGAVDLLKEPLSIGPEGSDELQLVLAPVSIPSNK